MAEQALRPGPGAQQRAWRRSDPDDFAPAGALLPLPAPPSCRPSPAAGLSIEWVAPRALPEGLLGALAGAGHGWLEEYHAAHDPDCLLVSAAAGVTVAEPVRLAFPAGRGTTLPRLLVRLEQGASLTLIEEHVAGGPESRVVGVAEAFLGPGARLAHLCHARLGEGARLHLTRRARLGPEARLESTLIFLGGQAVKVDHGALLAGAGAGSRLRSLAFCEGRQHLDLHTLHHHQAPRTISDMSVKVAVAGRSRSIYTGLIRIDPSCPGAEAYQENRNLILSPRARAEALPELEILTDDVLCTHGATLSPVDAEQLFYLESRGLSRGQALRLVLMGFFDACLTGLPDTLRAAVEEQLGLRLDRIGGGR